MLFSATQTTKVRGKQRGGRGRGRAWKREAGGGEAGGMGVVRMQASQVFQGPLPKERPTMLFSATQTTKGLGKGRADDERGEEHRGGGKAGEIGVVRLGASPVQETLYSTGRRCSFWQHNRPRCRAGAGEGREGGGQGAQLRFL